MAELAPERLLCIQWQSWQHSLLTRRRGSHTTINLKTYYHTFLQIYMGEKEKKLSIPFLKANLAAYALNKLTPERLFYITPVASPIYGVGSTQFSNMHKYKKKH